MEAVAEVDSYSGERDLGGRNSDAFDDSPTLHSIHSHLSLPRLRETFASRRPLDVAVPLLLLYASEY